MSVRWAIALALIAVWGCSGSKVAPLPPVPPVPPGYVRVPHPEGLDVGDLMAIFTDRMAPSPGEIQTCDADYRKLRHLTQSKQELLQGTRELVRADPVRYHWCFYAKLMTLEEKLSEGSLYIEERQKAVLDTYVFVTPFARAFLLEYQDSRYMRWAVNRYRRLSENVFYRRMDLSSETTAELNGASSPFGFQRTPAEQKTGVLTKYGIVAADAHLAATGTTGATGPTGSSFAEFQAGSGAVASTGEYTAFEPGPALETIEGVTGTSGLSVIESKPNPVTADPPPQTAPAASAPPAPATPAAPAPVSAPPAAPEAPASFSDPSSSSEAVLDGDSVTPQ